MTGEMIVRVLRAAFIQGIIVYWSCEEKEKKRMITGIYALLIMIPGSCSLMVYRQNLLLAMGFELTRAGLQILASCFLTKQKVQLFIKTTFYYIAFNYTFAILSMVTGIIFADWNRFVGIAEHLGIGLWPYVLTALLVPGWYWLVQHQVFEHLPYRAVTTAIIVLSIFDFGLGAAGVIKEGTIALKVLLCVSCGTALVLTGLIWLWERRKNMYEDRMMYQKILEGQDGFYQDVYRRQEELGRIRHDLANHMQTIQKLGSEEKQEEKSAYQRALLNSYDQLILMPVDEKKRKGKKERKKFSMIKVIGIAVSICVCILVGCEIHSRARFTFDIYQWSVFWFCAVCMFVGFAALYWKYNAEKKNVRLQQIVENGDNLKKEWEELQQRLQQMESEASERYAEQSSFSSNPILDAMLQNKYQQCRKLGIEANFNITEPPSGKIEQPDLIGLMSNLIDNGIEACIKCEDMKKHISVQTGVHANYWNIRIENTKRESERPVKTRFRTSKGEGHGLGTKIVKSIIRKYQGIIEYEDEGESFVVMAMVQAE